MATAAVEMEVSHPETVAPSHEALSLRLKRRNIKIKRIELRGVRPATAEEVYETPWYRPQRPRERHPRHTQSVVDPVCPDLEMLGDVRHEVPKPMTDERRRLESRTQDRLLHQELYGLSVAHSVRRHPDDELDDALRLRELDNDGTRERLAFHLDALDASGIVVIPDGLPPLTDCVVTLH